MEKKNIYMETTRQVNKVRELYSQIGQPLPSDIIIDLFRHLGKVQGAIKPQKKVHPPVKKLKA